MLKRLVGGGGTGVNSAASNVVDDALRAAEWIAKAMTGSGYGLDFSVESLKEVDRFFDEQAPNGAPRPDGLLAKDLGSRLFAIAAYVGEVIRRQLGGEWKGDDSDPQAEINISVRVNTGAVFWPVQRVMKRFKNGAEDGIYAYGVALIERGLA
jgi:hypothetical protein